MSTKMKAAWRSFERVAMPALMLALAAFLAALYFHAPQQVINALAGLAFLLAVPQLVAALLAPFALWKESSLPPEEIPDEWR